MGLLTVVALMLTKSRAGIGSSLLGLTVFLAVLAYYGGYSARPQRGFSAPVDPVWKRLGRVLAALLIVALFVSVFAGQTILRLGVQSTVDDGRFCVVPGLLRLLEDNWVVGTGLGTFRDVFPPYLDPECGIVGIWARAHNVYIESWINLGLPFVILATFIVISLFYVFLRGISVRRRMRFVPALGLSALIIVLAHSALDFSLQIPGFAAFWAAVLTPCIIIANNRPRNQTRVPPSLEVKQDERNSNTSLNF
jgi:O-antigen ligase